jgi:hypothetical protein
MTDQTPQSERLESGPREIARLNDCLGEHIASPVNDRVVMTVGVAELIGDVALCRGFRNVPRCCARFATLTPSARASTSMVSTT